MSRTKRRRRSVGGRILLFFVTIILIGLMCASICAATFAVYITKYIVPTVDLDLNTYRLNLTSFVYTLDENGNQQLMDRLHGDEDRVWVNIEDIPRNLQMAFISVEDSRFWTHNGVDWKRTIGAAMNFFVPISSFSGGGGSTITQQLIKNLTGDDDTSVKRKIKEIMRALTLEQNYEKEEILEMYLNTIYLGRGVYGVSQAAKTYFNKDLSELTLAECAAIAGITKNPYKYDLIRFPDFNRERRITVLMTMRDNGNISESEYRAARDEEVKAVRSSEVSADTVYNSYFTDTLINQLTSDLMEEKGYSRSFATRLLYGGGLKIICTMDPEIQEKMDSVFQDEENFPGDMGVDGTYPQAAMVLMDPYTGQVKALYGGRGKKEASLVLNRAVSSVRQPGSCIKPITVYAPAIENGIVTPISVVDDAPKDFTVRSTGWPLNENRTYSGLCTIYRGIGSSLNTVAVDLIMKLGYQKSFDFATNKMGITTLVERLVKHNSDGTTSVSSDIGASPLALGALTNGVSVYEMTAAYCTFVNDGYYTTPSLYTVVYDSEGRILLDNTPTVTVAMSQKTRDYMIQLLRYVVTNGTGKKAALGGIEVGGKTGTTTADNDRWFAGITPYYVGVVWFGYDKPQSLQKFSTNPALQLWYDVMSKVHEGLPDRAFQFKTQFVEVEYCMDSGEIPTDVCRMDLRGSRVAKAWVAVEDVPQTECSVHVALNIDTTNNCVANAACPSDKIKTIGALNLRRLYPYYGINITDQKYCAPYYVYQWELDAKLYKSATYTIQYCTAHDASTVVVTPDPGTNPSGDPGGSGGSEILPDPGGNGEPSDPGTGGGTTEPGTGGSGGTGGGTSGPPASRTDLF